MSRPDIFRTITGDDWRRQLAAARATPNAVSAQIKKILAQRVGKNTSRKDGK